MKSKKILNVVNIDKEILGGIPVFRGTRVPIETLFDHLEAGITIDDFLDDFPTVKRHQAIAVLEIAEIFVTSPQIKTLYESAA